MQAGSSRARPNRPSSPTTGPRFGLGPAADLADTAETPQDGTFQGMFRGMDLAARVRMSAIVFVVSSGCGSRVGLTVADASHGSGGFIGSGGVAHSDGSGGSGGLISSGGVGGVGKSLVAGGAGGVSGVGESRVDGGSGGIAGSGTTGGRGGNGGARTSAASGGNTGSGGTSQCPTNQCEAFGSSCTGTEVPVRCIETMPDSITEGRNPSCEEVCGGNKCCVGIGPCTATAVKCPSGQLCAYPDAMEDTTDFVAKCMPEQQTCGGSTNKLCPDDQYCELFGILCSQPPTVRCPSTASLCDYARKGGVGVCRVKPPDSQCPPGGQPVCGCDGVTYTSSCARIAANVFLDHTGSCSQDGGTAVLDAGMR